jgi:hypothetical protein
MMSDEHESDEPMPSGDELAGMLLNQVEGVVNDDRDTHGDAVENQQHIARGWTWYLRGQGVLAEDEELDGLDVAYMMGLVKMSRNAVGEFDIDHPRDIAGYAGIGGACKVAEGEASVEEISGDTDDRR